MKVEMEVTFTQDEVLDAVRVELEKIDCGCEGHWKLRPGYYNTGEVVATFVPVNAKSEDDRPLVQPPTLPMVEALEPL